MQESDMWYSSGCCAARWGRRERGGRHDLIHVISLNSSLDPGRLSRLFLGGESLEGCPMRVGLVRLSEVSLGGQGER